MPGIEGGADPDRRPQKPGAKSVTQSGLGPNRDSRANSRFREGRYDACPMTQFCLLQTMELCTFELRRLRCGNGAHRVSALPFRTNCLALRVSRALRN